MRRYNKVSRILLILTVTTFAIAAPALVQEKRQAGVDEVPVHVPNDPVTVLGKRITEEEEVFNVLWDGYWHYLNVLGKPLPPPVPWRNRYPVAVHDWQEPAPPPNPAEVHVPPQSPAESSKKLDDEAPLEKPGPLTDSYSDSGRRPTISNAPSGESQSEDLKAADSEMGGKAKVSRRISGTANFEWY